VKNYEQKNTTTSGKLITAVNTAYGYVLYKLVRSAGVQFAICGFGDVKGNERKNCQ